MDRRFGKGGSATTRLPSSGRRRLTIADVLPLPDGKRALTGMVTECADELRGPCDVGGYVARIRSTGRIDREFGADGIAEPKLGAAHPDMYYGSGRRDFPDEMVLLPDERLVIAGSALRTIEEGGTRNVYLLARFEDVVAPQPTQPFPRRFGVRHGAIRMRVGCREAGPVCAGRLVVTSPRRFTLTPGETRTIKVRISPRARRRLAARGLVRVRATLSLNDAHGNRAERRRTVILRVAKPVRASSARTAAPAQFFGMHADQAFASVGTERATILRDVRATGVRVIRQQLDWSQVERERGIYDWSDFDAYVEAVVRADLDLLPILIGPPAFRSTDPAGQRRGFYPPRRPRTFATFAAAAVFRYGPGGVYWTDHPEVPRHPIRDWQVWNEPSLAYFWRPKPNARRFGSMLRQAAAAIHFASPRVRVIAPALPQSDYGVPLMKYLARMSAAAGRRGYDVAAVNPYARTVPDMLRLLRRARRWLDRHGRKRVPISVSEFGWASFDERDQPRQASLVADAVRTLARQRRTLKLANALHYSWQDADPFAGGADFWGIHTGLLDRGGDPKLSWYAFREAIRAVTRR